MIPDDYFFQESLFRMGRIEPIDVESEKVVEAYVVQDSDLDPAETALRNYQLELDLYLKDTDSYDYRKEEEKACQG